ncbi:MAG: nucleotidyl transferase AbiEii/AbiGii toxin family protein, partial [Bacteroidales bacterium]|nr:nucleotidyl transferase AbiEii/AbiGii toxin family protein [Bacteroidales bacterium]
MLHKETIDSKTLELLIDLQKEPLLSSFNLVGGTALALHLGHRRSVDLDFFTSEAFDL